MALEVNENSVTQRYVASDVRKFGITVRGPAPLHMFRNAFGIVLGVRWSFRTFKMICMSISYIRDVRVSYRVVSVCVGSV